MLVRTLSASEIPNFSMVLADIAILGRCRDALGVTKVVKEHDLELASEKNLLVLGCRDFEQT